MTSSRRQRLASDRDASDYHRPMIRGARKLAAIVLAACSTLRAGDLPGAGSPTLKGESHAWVALPLEGSEGGAAIVHVPPRRDASRTDGRGDAEDGSLHMVARVAQVPERLAAWDRELWMVFGAEPAGPGKRQRRVLTMQIERGPLAGAWVPSPQGERLPTVASLPGDGSLVGFAGTPKGPVALIQQRADGFGKTFGLFPEQFENRLADAGEKLL